MDSAKPAEPTVQLVHEIIALRTALKADRAVEAALQAAIASHVRALGIPLSDALADTMVLALPAEVVRISASQMRPAAAQPSR